MRFLENIVSALNRALLYVMSRLPMLRNPPSGRIPSRTVFDDFIERNARDQVRYVPNTEFRVIGTVTAQGSSRNTEGHVKRGVLRIAILEQHYAVIGSCDLPGGGQIIRGTAHIVTFNRVGESRYIGVFYTNGMFTVLPFAASRGVAGDCVVVRLEDYPDLMELFSPDTVIHSGDTVYHTPEPTPTVNIAVGDVGVSDTSWGTWQANENANGIPVTMGVQYVPSDPAPEEEAPASTLEPQPRRGFDIV